MKLTHPKSAQVVEVDDSRKATYLSQGWQPVESKAPAKPKADKDA